MSENYYRSCQGKSPEKPYQELKLEQLRGSYWYRKLVFYHKIKNKLSLKYLSSYLCINTKSQLITPVSQKMIILKHSHEELKALKASSLKLKNFVLIILMNEMN